MKVIVIQNPSGFDAPLGGILLWYGLEAELPPGYEIYTEVGGYFVRGGDAVDLTPAGAETHEHEFTSVANAPDHTHPVSTSITGYAGSTGIGYLESNLATTPEHVHAGGGSSQNAGEHTHTLAKSGSGSSMPAHKRLYYIRRVA